MSEVRSDYQVFREARDIIEKKGWLKHERTDGRRSCLGQALVTAADEGHVWTLSERHANIVHRHMQDKPVYAMAYKFNRSNGYPHTEAVMAAIPVWNDMVWRHKGGVVKLLDEILNDLAHEEIVRLNEVIAELRAEMARREKRMSALESENASWRKRFVSFVLHPADRSALQQLSDELDQEWERLQEADARVTA